VASNVDELQHSALVEHKKKFFMLALLIPGKQSLNYEFFDVYLEPLVEELAQL